MEKLLLEIDLRNAAFADENPALEVARILRNYADKIEARGLSASVLFDVNGNRCGAAYVNGGK